MTSSEQVLSEFMDAWNAGRRPRVAAYVERVPEAERAAFAEELTTWLTVAPTPAYDEAALAEIRAAPVVRRLQDATTADAGLLQLELPRLRARHRWSVRQLADAIVGTLGLAPGDVDRTEDYLERVERGEHDASRLSRRLLDALGRSLGVSGDTLRSAAALSSASFRPATAGGTLFRADADRGRWVADDLQALTSAAMAPAPDELDEVDRLFCGGPEG